MKRGGRGGFKPWYSKGSFQQQKEKPLFSFTKNGRDDDEAGGGSLNTDPQNSSDISFSTDREPGSYVGWKLYFPFKTYKESPDLVRRIEAMERHFNSKEFINLYNIAEIEEKCLLPLPIENLQSDEKLLRDWPNIFEDLSTKSTLALACIALAMHNIIVKKQSTGKQETFQHHKIFTRPIGSLNNPMKLSTAIQTNGEMITVTGTVIHEEPIKTSCKMVCFRCSACNAELVVKQNPQFTHYVQPSTCRKGCPARGRFIESLSSPFTMYQAKQMIRLQESLYVDSQEFQKLEVELIQDLVDKAVLGTVVTVTGVIKHGVSKKAQKFVRKNEAKLFKSYLKCFNVEIVDTLDTQKCDAMTMDEKEIIEITKAQPSPFRLLVHSLCPSIYGREEVKAGLILALLSGSDLLKKRRSESHVLMVGSPGAGKSKLLQACAEVSTKGILVSGPTSTAVGLTASVGKSGNMDAGSLILANGGACCIDEFDKMSSHSHILLESMEQQIISITKCGVRVNLPSSVVVIAAANPKGSFYDRTKTLAGNVRITAPLLSRFDLIYTLGEQDKSSDAAFIKHVSKKPKMMGNDSKSFFGPQQVVNKDKISWLKLQPGEELDIMPSHFLQLYIGFARENIHPTLSQEAKDEIRRFFLKLRELTIGFDAQTVTYRQIEALVRLTLARARADLAEVATKEHAIDIINLSKFTMTDIFEDESLLDSSEHGSFRKSKTPNCSSLSKPKQLKAFIEHLRDLEQEEYTTSHLKEIAKELGIRDIYEIVDKLNHAGELLKTADGYKVVN